MVDVKNSGVAEKEQVNEYRKDMMDKAMKRIKALCEEEYSKRVGQTVSSFPLLLPANADSRS